MIGEGARTDVSVEFNRSWKLPTDGFLREEGVKEGLEVGVWKELIASLKLEPLLVVERRNGLFPTRLFPGDVEGSELEDVGEVCALLKLLSLSLR
jgi:hypothetical protein